MAERQLVLITGASSGIGTAFAQEFAARGCDLVLVARRRQRLQELSQCLRNDHQIEAHVVVADLSKPAGVDDVLAAIDGLGRAIDVLVNSAGFGSY
jgi:uncharacterized protein